MAPRSARGDRAIEIAGFTITAELGDDAWFDVLAARDRDGSPWTVVVAPRPRATLDDAATLVAALATVAPSGGMAFARSVAPATVNGAPALAIVCDPLPDDGGPTTLGGAPPAADLDAAFGRVVATLTAAHIHDLGHGLASDATWRWVHGRLWVVAPGCADLVAPRAPDAIRAERWVAPELDRTQGRVTARRAMVADVYSAGLLAHTWALGELPASARRVRQRRAMARAADAPSPGRQEADVDAATRSRLRAALPIWGAAVAAALGPVTTRPSSARVLQALTAAPARAPAAHEVAASAASAQAAASRFRPLLRPSAPRGRPSTRMLGGLLLLCAAAAAAAWFVLREKPAPPPYVPSCASDGDCAAALRCQDGLCGADGFAFVPAATFTAGSARGERRGRNAPVIDVAITRGFYIQTTEVTQGEFRRVTGTAPSWFSGCGDTCPAESVNWYEAVAFANERSRLDGLAPCYVVAGCAGTLGEGCPELRPTDDDGHSCVGEYYCATVQFVGLDCEGYRLPTEYEWELAARGGTADSTYVGPLHVPGETREQSYERLGAAALTSQNARTTTMPAWPCGWIDEPRADAKYCGPSPTGERRPNAFGLYDVLGNVTEWTHDGWMRSPRVDPDGTCSNPVVGPSGNVECAVDLVADRHIDTRGDKTVRGGAWFHSLQLARAATRGGLPANTRWVDIGFRLARTAQPPR